MVFLVSLPENPDIHNGSSTVAAGSNRQGVSNKHERLAYASGSIPRFQFVHSREGAIAVLIQLCLPESQA